MANEKAEWPNILAAVSPATGDDQTNGPLVALCCGYGIGSLKQRVVLLRVFV